MKKRFLLLWIGISALANVWLQEQIFVVNTYCRYYREERQEELRALVLQPGTQETCCSGGGTEEAAKEWAEQMIFSCMGSRPELPPRLGFAGRAFAKHFIPKDLWVQSEETAGKILADFKYFPVAVPEGEKETLTFENSWGGARDYGGSRRHEGCDIMTSNNERGYFEIVSVSDAVVEKIGWLELGGYRVGLRSKSGIYYYYAHLDSYREGLKEGMRVKAGEVIGKMGDSGYGKEGTRGKFDVHLHFGIYTDAAASYSVNPFYILKAYRDCTVPGTARSAGEEMVSISHVLWYNNKQYILRGDDYGFTYSCRIKNIEGRRQYNGNSALERDFRSIRPGGGRVDCQVQSCKTGV